MSISSNGFSSPEEDARANSSSRSPRRVVLLCDGQESEVERVLHEYHGAEVSGNRLHADIKQLADEHFGRYVAAEWLGPLGWIRFLWCRREANGNV